jgi:hypothetical protein
MTTRRVLVAAVVAVALGVSGPAARAQRGVNKIPVRQVEAALVMDTGALRIRLTLATNEALDYEVRDQDTVSRVLQFIEVSSGSSMSLAAEISTDGRTLRALHLTPEAFRPAR